MTIVASDREWSIAVTIVASDREWSIAVTLAVITSYPVLLIIFHISACVFVISMKVQITLRIISPQVNW